MEANPDDALRPRRGRPPATEAGLAEERVLAAATTLFLELGFGRTTLDKVSQLSKTGKSALYGRYPDKHSLFAAVVDRSIRTMFDEVTAASSGHGIRDRLRHVGFALAESLLVPRCVALMRITAAEAVNFPDLARMAYQVSFEGSVRCVLDAMEVGSLETVSLAKTRTAERFVELALQPLSFQAAFGVDIASLKRRYVSDVEDAILLLEAKGLLPIEGASGQQAGIRAGT